MGLDDDAELSERPNQMQIAAQDLDTDTEEDAQVRTTNAYPGSTNDIGSIHQRHWFLQLDPQSSGFVLGNRGDERENWTRGFEPFIVRSRFHERSVVIVGLAREVESDERRMDKY